MLELKPRKWAGAIRTVTLGAGTRRPLVVGGGNGLPLHTFEATLPHRPLLALEVTDVDPLRWPDAVRGPWAGVLGHPAGAAKCAVEQFGADLVMLHLAGAHPDRGNRPAETAAADVRAVLAAVAVPLIVKGPGAGQKQNEVLARVAEECSGEGLVLHSACQEDYRTLAAAAVAYGHVLVAESPIDMNIAKQLNILLADASVDLNRVLIDPLTGGLGYGLEYTYSVMERIRLAALAGDAMLNPPLICLVGEEAWKAKEAKTGRACGIHWEIATGLAMLEAGAEVLVLRHPEALARLRAQLDSWFDGGATCR
ncbi:MAG: acetyl-CoA decarbonylase/synthase complex subunit delta [Acidobacteria bacterium]|nr:acetyl-CoA decarbonylase/synthase complex subunit delta [Acidobacteriota bacterium]